MKQKGTILVAFFTLTLLLAACGFNPVQQIEEEVSEQVAEELVEQVTSVDNVNIEGNEDDASVSFSVDDGEGGQMDISINEAIDTNTLTGMGFEIALPEGITNGAVQRMDENGEEAAITASYEAPGVSGEDFLRQLDASLKAAGFAYVDAMGAGNSEPDFAGFQQMPFASYEHPNGAQMTIIWGDGGAVLTLVRDGNATAGSGMDAVDTASGGTESSAPAVPVAFDGSLTIDQNVVPANGDIVVSLVVNSPVESDAWVGIVPAETPHGREVDSDMVDTTYAYISDAVDGQVTLVAPATPGLYDVRLFNTDSDDGVELTFVTFTVTE